MPLDLGVGMLRTGSPAHLPGHSCHGSALRWSSSPLRNRNSALCHRWLGLLLLTLMLAAATTAHAEKRVALLIGNEGYARDVGQLTNPHNDVALLEQTLKGLGFDVVTVRDTGLGVLHQALNGYARRVQVAGGNAVAFFYYSGHGASDGGTNYLIPVDVKTTETGELWDQSLRLTEITRKLKTEAGNATHFVVFDACRNTLKLRQADSRALVQSKGFVPVAQENGMLVAYATAEGELATDVGVGAGPYAMALAEEIIKPGIEAVVMFRAVQRRVRAAIRQEPYLGFNALGDVYFAGKTELPVSTTEAERAWAAVKDTKSTDVLQSFAERYKDTIYAELARVRKRDLEAQQKMATIAMEMEVKRLAALEQQAEERRRAGELQKQQAGAVQPPPKPPLLPSLIDKSVGIILPPVAGNCDGVAIDAGAGDRRCFKPGAGKTEWFKDCAYCPEMVIVPAGEFLMGSPAQDGRASANELPQHQVKIPRHFAIGRFEVTRKQFEAFLLATGRDRIGGCWVWTAYGHRWQSERGYRSPSFSQEDDHPVVCVSWDDAQAYGAWLSRTTLRAYRVPTEAEWEYAARAGSSTAYYFGEDSRSLCDHANGADQITAFQWGNLTCSDGVGVQTARVGRYQPNAFGLYDVLGNVSEWVQDCVNETYTSAPPTARHGPQVIAVIA
jgi:formylglycine-generating enzyme required for sulfatase activity